MDIHKKEHQQENTSLEERGTEPDLELLVKMEVGKVIIIQMIDLV